MKPQAVTNKRQFCEEWQFQTLDWLQRRNKLLSNIQAEMQKTIFTQFIAVCDGTQNFKRY